MKTDNNLIKVTDLMTNEVWWCTKTTYAAKIIGCVPAAIWAKKYKKQFNVEIADGRNVKWKDINTITMKEGK